MLVRLGVGRLGNFEDRRPNPNRRKKVKIIGGLGSNKDGNFNSIFREREGDKVHFSPR